MEKCICTPGTQSRKDCPYHGPIIKQQEFQEMLERFNSCPKIGYIPK